MAKAIQEVVNGAIRFKTAAKSYNVPRSTLQRRIKAFKWNEIWRNEETKLHKHRVNTWDERPQFQSREDQCSLTKLRIGHTTFSHGYLLNKEDPKSCPACIERASV
ncbi:Protein of unknown function [Cotesia congregata]|uniref:HTH psq-type domain-containing protein n=1 Tax=Cotesia congregata TaxID=51543 RepID=A0A8J2H869_COTCN|nr:Protein of unknown function [Cotesia congregata]